MELEPDSWILMTDQQKGLEIAIRNKLPDAEHRFPYPPIVPLDTRVLPRRLKRCRNKDDAERRKEVGKQAEKKASKKGEKQDAIFKASRKGAVMNCKICGGIGHNTRTCPRKPVDREATTSRNKRSSRSSL
ncbi:hypothetical protein LIER_20471 [Lithospermum erythrorhizon]|uniref:CCHC-type domain-containing protein n=1 Tax=Lithospermum erythrorhizon TaxID=34254 RepID=A0AAV3QP25_LITER